MQNTRARRRNNKNNNQSGFPAGQIRNKYRRVEDNIDFPVFDDPPFAPKISTLHDSLLQVIENKDFLKLGSKIKNLTQAKTDLWKICFID